MVKLRIRSMVAAGFVVLVSFASSRAQAPSTTNDAAIKKTIDEWADAYNRHSAHDAAVEFTDDARMVSVAGIVFDGRTSIADHYSRTFSTSLKNAHRVDTVKNIRYLTPDIASVDVDWEITGSTAKTADDHSEIPLRKGILDLVFVKKSGQWSVAVSHEIEFPVKAKS